MNRPYSFTPLETFEAYVNGRQNTYCAGLRYTVRAGEPWDDLHAKAQVWLKAGKIRLIG